MSQYVSWHLRLLPSNYKAKEEFLKDYPMQQFDNNAVWCTADWSVIANFDDKCDSYNVDRREKSPRIRLYKTVYGLKVRIS